MTNKSKTERLEKIVGAGQANVKKWHAVVLDDADQKYYTNELTPAKRRLLTDAELAEMRSPGHGMIVVRMVDAPIPPGNTPLPIESAETRKELENDNRNG